MRDWNTSCSLPFPNSRSHSLVSHNGTLGQLRHVQEFEYTCDKGTLLIMRSDGLSTRWKMTQYLDLIAGEPAIITGAL